MDALTRFGLEKSRFTGLVMICLLLMGLSAYFGLPKREDPSITIRTAAIVAEFDGMAPGRVENLIAVPIERKLREISAIEDIETIITTGRALIYVHLYDEVPVAEIEDAWEDLRNKMGAIAGALPEGTRGPTTNTDYGDVAIATVAITGDGFDLAALEDVAEDLRTFLARVDGVSKVELFGAQEPRVWLELDTRKLASVGVQLNQLLADLQAQNVILPAGEIDADGTNFVLEANGDLASIEAIENVLTRVEGLAGYVRLADLVEVRPGFVDPKEAPVFFNGRPAVLASIEMAETADIQPLGRELRAALTAFENAQPIGVALNLSTFQETNVTKSVNDALINVAQTFVVVFLVLLLFLGFRAAGVTACIVPFTLMFALAGMTLLGVDVQKVSIAAVIVSLGLLVDNGLVVVEDIEGRINRGAPPEEAARAAGGQFVTPLAIASITTVSAFIPMFLVDGADGEYAFALGAVVALMLFGSWLTALYILPFLAARVLRPKPAAAQKGALIAAYGRVTRRLLPFGAPIMGGVFLLVALSATQFGQLKREMFPLAERNEFLIYMDMPKGVAISETERQALRVNEWLMDRAENPGVVNTTIFVGAGGPRFYLSLDPADPDPASAFFVVNMESFEAVRETVARARRVLVEAFPEARFRVARLSMGGNESGIVDIEITGPDANVLLDVSRRVEAAFAERVPALVRNETNWGNKVVKIVVDIQQDKARELGVTSQEISEVMSAYFTGAQYSTFRRDDEQIPIVLRATGRERDSVEDLANFTIAANGALISIDQIATFRPKMEFSEIRRENQVRQVIVSAKSETLAATEVIALIQPVLDDLALGPDYGITIAGEIENSADVYRKLGGGLPLAMGVMALALMFQFNSVRRCAVTILTIPIILIGAPFALLIAGAPMSFFAVLGLMSLMGIIINNAIVLIDQIDIERRTKTLEDAIVSAAEQRAKPIMLTSLTSIFGLAPMAISGGALFEPMATIMMGGLLVASPVTLFFVPAACWFVMRARGRGAAAAQPKAA